MELGVATWLRDCVRDDVVTWLGVRVLVGLTEIVRDWVRLLEGVCEGVRVRVSPVDTVCDGDRVDVKV